MPVARGCVLVVAILTSPMSAQLKDGYDTFLGLGQGGGLSVGQRQRVAIVRFIRYIRCLRYMRYIRYIGSESRLCRPT